MTRNIEEMSKYFVNPEEPGSAENLVEISAETIRAMAQIYAHRGKLENMDKPIQEWLSSQPVEFDSLKQVIGELLKREAGTRHFDEKFMGQIHPQGNKVGILASLIAAYMNTNTIVKEVSVAEHKMELEAVDWLINMFGYDPKMASGNITAGGTTANMAALWVARERIIRDRLGKAGARNKNMFILGTTMAHYSVDKAANILGSNVWLGRTPLDGYKTDICGMEEVIQRIQNKGGDIAAIVGLAGETETGMVDDLHGLADLAEKYKIYLHVDAAYGGPFKLSRNGSLFDGIERADSITVDPHKMLYTPYPAGAILFKNRDDHALIQRGNARYLGRESGAGVYDPEGRNFGFAARVEGSMGSAGVLMTWATIKLLEREGIGAILDHALDLAQYAYTKVEGSSLLSPLHVPETNTLLIGINKEISIGGETRQKIMKEVIEKKGIEANSMLDEEWDRIIYGEVIAKVQKMVDDQGYYVSLNEGIDKRWGGKTMRAAWRMVPTHPHTTQEDVEEVISMIEDAVRVFLN